MISLYKGIIRPVLFLRDPDMLHEGFNKLGLILGSNPFTRRLVRLFLYYGNPKLETKVLGIKFENPVGLAAGFDKGANLIQLMPSVGFGFTECGSITSRPYSGNKRPWNVRLKKDKALIVNYGLKNEGVKVLKRKIAKSKKFCPLIISVAKTNDPSLKGGASIEDFNKAFAEMQPLSDIMDINTSCPNTGDKKLFCESPELLDKLLTRIGQNRIIRPVVIKLKPDISDETLDGILAVCKKHAYVKGFVISNLTSNRKRLKNIDLEKIKDQPGAISGKPVQELSDNMIKKVYSKTKGKYAIIGCGGIFSAEDAYRKICLGASLVQLITGMIYEGPALIKEINKGLVRLMENDGFNNISEAVGSKNS